MKNLIILKATSNKGKSRTLHLLINHLVTSCAGTIVYQVGYKQGSCNRCSQCTNCDDCFVIIDVPGMGRVGVITQGDNGYQQNVINYLNVCTNYNCDSIVAASHPREMTRMVTILTILLTFGRNNNLQTIITTPYEYYSGAAAVDEQTLNSVCVRNLANLLYSL